jgi:hypothetical protein
MKANTEGVWAGGTTLAVKRPGYPALAGHDA